MESPAPRSRARPLRQAAAAVFAVTTIVPLLIFVWTLHRLDALSRTQAQIGLGLALAIALLGFQIFRVLMGRMSDLVQSLGKAVEQAARSAQRSGGTTTPQSVLSPPAAAAAPHGEARPSVFARPAPGAPQPRPEVAPPASAPKASAPTAPPGVSAPRPPHAGSALMVPGIGDVQEVQDLSRAMALLWMSEATVLKGQRVSISILSAPRPVTGTLVDVADGGLVLQPDGTAAPIILGYGRVAAIDREQPPGER
ncbi:MAG: hypothetical protein HY615_01830 [Candidatus Rokubacteria bacterium]|nr:hypothetical protein [Candidatus Rokubacteria bacterium]